MNVSDFIAKNGKAPEAGTEVYAIRYNSWASPSYTKGKVVKATPTGRKVVVKFDNTEFEKEFHPINPEYHESSLDFDIVKVEKDIANQNAQKAAAEALNKFQDIVKDNVRNWAPSGMRQRINELEAALKEADKYVMAYEEIEKINRE
jgi:hypothetical protein